LLRLLDGNGDGEKRLFGGMVGVVWKVVGCHGIR